MFLELWSRYMADVHATDDTAAMFYLTVGLVASVPMGVLSRQLAKIPVDWIDKKTAPYMVGFVGWTICWFLAYFIPGIDSGMLRLAVGLGSLAGSKTVLDARDMTESGATWVAKRQAAREAKDE